MLEYEALPGETGRRLDVLVAGLYPQFSRSALELLFDRHMVWVNGRVSKASYKVRKADNVRVDETCLTKQPGAIDIPVLYEDDDVIVIDKPAGILSHSKGALNLEATVASFIKNKLADEKLMGSRAGIVHRLDRPTSGVMITAKTSAALSWLQKQFATRRVKKTYRAVAEGQLQPPEAVIEAPIARNPKKPQTFRVAALGRPAISRYRVIKQFKRGGHNYSEVELSPQTGRTHQLRVHMAYIGHPVVGDNIYGRSGGPLLLHAESLELTLPNKERRIFRSQRPQTFSDFVNHDK